MIIRLCESRDVAQICEIYNYYINHTVITFETEPLTISEMSERIDAYTKVYPWFVCEVEGRIVGYAYASKWKERSAYKNTAEVTVYLKNGLSRQGFGKALYASLLQSLRELKCHVVLACIALPNEPSEKLHEHLGFKKVAHFSEVGYKFGNWVDVGYWQKVNT
ncbi:TPA: N-acetyltransferase [Pseudomonas aeruginosa]|nr:N-acetyltransferase [Pseudomonas aeruginosa]HEQ0030150.1 N-acetyltransferase [Pseudomonas aeruginosa]